MRLRQTKRSMIVAAVVIAAMVLNFAWAAVDHRHHMASKADAQSGKQPTLQQLHEKILPQALASLHSAKQAVQAGHKEHALSELNKLGHALMTIQASIEHHVGPAFANTQCPIMGSPIKPEKVTDDLVRSFNGKKVAFCCAGCPAQWDKLSDTQKSMKLQAALPAKGHDASHQGHQH